VIAGYVIKAAMLGEAIIKIPCILLFTDILPIITAESMQFRKCCKIKTIKH
jgi:hypothetical protein